MRKKKVWRYWCDHCSKGGCSGGAMAKHERGCTRNPYRECGLCRIAELEQTATAILIGALKVGGLDALRQAASGCPACILAAIIQDRRQRGVVLSRLDEEECNEELARYGADQFDYKKDRDVFWVQVNRNRERDF